MAGSLTAGCAAPGLGPWAPMAARQVSVPLARGTTVVEVRDRAAGWSERVEVGSEDGAAVSSGADAERISGAPEPPLDAETMAFWRSQAGQSAGGSTDLERAVALCGWVVRRTYGRKAETRPDGGRRPEVLVGVTGREALDAVDAGGKFTCYSVSTILHDAARAFGLRTRRVDLGVRHLSPFEAHSVVEVWLRDEGRWAVVDPTFDATYEIGGRPAGALAIHEAVRAGRISEVAPRRRAGSPAPDPLTYRIDPLLFFRCLYVILPSGHWLTRLDADTPPPPVTSPSHLLATSDAAFETGGDPLELVHVRRGASGGHVAFQAAGGRLYVCVADGAYKAGSAEVRVSGEGAPAFHPDTPPHDPADAVLLRPIELLTDPAFTTLGATREHWTVSGDLSVERDGEAVELEAAGDCAVESGPVPLTDVPYVAFLEVEVEAGEVAFGFDGRAEEAVPVGPMRRVSTRVLAPRESVPVTIRLGDGARCRVRLAGLRRAKPLYEALGLPDPAGGRPGAGPASVRHVPFDPFRGRRR